MNLDKRHQLWIGLALVALLALTRGHHFASIENLPSASWAVFFLAGFYLRSAWAFALLLGEAVLLDYAAITFGGVSSFCVTPAYGFLLPAYGSLWLAGRRFAARYALAWSALLPFAAAFMMGAVASELFSSGGFYFFGGRYVDPTLAEFGSRLVQYFPRMLSSFAFWVATATVVHLAFAYTSGLRRGQKV
jgi:hypothetical protein